MDVCVDGSDRGSCRARLLVVCTCRNGGGGACFCGQQRWRGNSPGQDSCLTAAPGRGAHSKRSCATAATTAAWNTLGPHPTFQSSLSSSRPSSDFPSSKKLSATRLNGSSGSRGKKSPGPVGVKVGMEAGVYVAVHALHVGENVLAADGSPGSQDPLQRVWLEVHVWAADAGVQGGGHATSVVDDERRRP